MARDYVLPPFQGDVKLRIDYAAELNPQQHAVVTALPGPSLVISGAGSGKTRTLIYRVAFLLEQGIPPDRILLLTFTNKAAGEMMRRVAGLLGNEMSGDLWGGTFHSIGYRTLRRHADKLGFRPDFKIVDRDDARELLAATIGESEIDTTESRFPKPEVLAEIFSLAANKEESVKNIINADYDYFSEWESEIIDIRGRYQERKRKANVMDFDDLLVLWLKLLRDFSDVRELYQRRFQFVLVDEYQDSNKLQGNVVDLIAARHGNVMAVGDDAQSIYSWRGAHFRNILEFQTRYPGAQIYRIEINYRSTPEILSVANEVLKRNVHQFKKELVAHSPSGPKPVLAACHTSSEQAIFVAHQALALRDEGYDLNKIAVLYRSHFHALELQLELTRRNIPFQITSGIRFFEQAHVKDVGAFLRFVSNPQDEISFKRMVKLLPGIGAKAADKLWNAFAATFATTEEISLGARLQTCKGSIPKKSAVPWAQLVTTLVQLETKIVGPPSSMIELVLEAMYEEYLKSEYPNFRQRLEDIQQLATFARTFQSIDEFLNQLALMTGLTDEGNANRDKDEEQIRLSTVHQAKGLEFDVVFVIMLCDGLFPSSRSMETPEGEEEERRLFYVAVTRARHELYLSYPIVRFSGPGTETMQRPSRFIDEIPKEMLDELNLQMGW